MVKFCVTDIVVTSLEGCHVVSATDPHGRQSLFSRPGAATFFIQVAPQLTSRG
jgi:hypothetical protein